MEVRNCPRCGKVFTVLPSKTVCPDCEKREDEEFKMVKSYIEDNPQCSLDEVVAETEVPLKRIAKFIREGRLEISPGLRGDFRCESCGAEISKGRYCHSCFAKMKTDLTNAFTNPALVNVRNSGKMHLSKRL